MKKIFLFAAVAMLALVGCEKQKQSSLDFEQVQSNATITGRLVYFADKLGTNTAETPLASQRVYFMVDDSLYAKKAEGVKSFEAITDADGNYSITVPTGKKEIKGKLMTDVIVIGEAPNRIYFEEYNSKKGKEITLYAGDAKVEKTIVDIDEVLTACQGTATLKGQVKYDAGYDVTKSPVEKGLVTAPAGVQVAAVVTYADAARRFYAKTDDKGNYQLAIPVMVAELGKKIDTVIVAQFAGKYTDYLNDELLSQNALFEFSAFGAAVPTLKDGEVSFLDMTAKKIDESMEDPDTKIMIKVRGEILMQAEAFKYGTGDEAKKIESLQDTAKGTVPYLKSTDKELNVNDGKFKLYVIHKDGAKELSRIVYDFNTDEKGKYEKDVEFPAAWDAKDVKIQIEVIPFLYKAFKHYYYVPNYKESNTWQTWSGTWQEWVDKSDFTNHYKAQDCECVYWGKSGEIAANLYFPAKVDAKLKFNMSQDSKDALLGVGNTDASGNSIDEKKEDGNTYVIAKGGYDYPDNDINVVGE